MMARSPGPLCAVAGGAHTPVRIASAPTASRLRRSKVIRGPLERKSGLDEHAVQIRLAAAPPLAEFHFERGEIGQLVPDADGRLRVVQIAKDRLDSRINRFLES